MLLCLNEDMLSYVVGRVDADDLLPCALACTRVVIKSRTFRLHPSNV